MTVEFFLHAHDRKFDRVLTCLLKAQEACVVSVFFIGNKYLIRALPDILLAALIDLEPILQCLKHFTCDLRLQCLICNYFNHL